MRQKSFIFLAVFLGMLVAGAVGVYAYDSSRDDRIAEGVTVAGADVGGLTTTAARTVVRRQVAARLERPVVVTHGHRRFTVSARDAQLRADVGGMVDDALKASREGSILSRVARDLTGGREHASVAARVSYSRAAIAGLVNRVGKALNRPAQDARVDFPALTQVKEHDGLKVKADALRQDVERELATPSPHRAVEAPVRVTKPKVTRAQLADKYPSLLVVDRSNFQLRLYKRLRLAHTYSIAVGAQGFDTPAGLYHIQNKAVDPPWHVPNKPWAGSLAGTTVPGGTADNPIKARWLGIFNGAGIHGTTETYSLGHAASHGCVRMAIADVVSLYPQVAVGTPIYIGD